MAEMHPQLPVAFLEDLDAAQFSFSTPFPLPPPPRQRQFLHYFLDSVLENSFDSHLNGLGLTGLHCFIVSLL